MNLGTMEWIIIAAIIFGFIMLMRWIVRPRQSGVSSQAVQNEQQLLRELFDQMRRMEQRLENLETILLEKDAARK